MRYFSMAVLAILLGGYFLSLFYEKSKSVYEAQLKSHYTQVCMDERREHRDAFINRVVSLCGELNSTIESQIKEELRSDVQEAVMIASALYEEHRRDLSKDKIKVRIKEALFGLGYNSHNAQLYIRDTDLNSIFESSGNIKDIANYKDADFRSIGLEEIQKVGRYGEGYIYSKNGFSGEDEILFVKKLGFYNWYIGSSLSVNAQKERVKSNFLTMLQKFPLSQSELFGVIDEHNTTLYSSSAKSIVMEKIVNDTMSRVESCALFKWRFVYTTGDENRAF